MSAYKRHKSDLRDEYTAQTRERIVVTFVDLLKEGDAEDVSMAALAKRANIAERTIYRHFKTRAELLANAGEWIEANIFGYIPFESPDQLPEIFREVCERFDRHPNLAKALAQTRVGRSLLADFRQRLIERSRAAMMPLTQNLEPEKAQQAVAIMAYLNSALVWSVLREDFGMTGEEVASSVGWAMTALLKDLREQNAATSTKTPSTGRKSESIAPTKRDPNSRS